jgi:hypothetical protein
MRWLLCGCFLLSGCAHSLLLVKAVQVSHGENSYTKCIVETSDKVNQEIKTKANELCAEVHKQFPPNLPSRPTPR